MFESHILALDEIFNLALTEILKQLNLKYKKKQKKTPNFQKSDYTWGPGKNSFLPFFKIQFKFGW